MRNRLPPDDPDAERESRRQLIILLVFVAVLVIAAIAMSVAFVALGGMTGGGD